MKKKNLLFVLIVALIFPFSFALTGCGDNYEVKLTKSFDKNGFEIQTTEDYVLEECTEGIRFSSAGDEVIFDRTTMFGQFDYGNEFYSVATTSVSEYASDIVKLENVTLTTPTTVKAKERKSDNTIQEVELNEYVINEKTNPEGNWDSYTAMFFGKTEKAFVYFNFRAIIENKNIDKWTTKCEKIISSAILKPSKDVSYDENVKTEISSDIKSTGEHLKDLNIVLHLPDNYVLWGNEVAWLNFLDTFYNSEDRWSSTIRFESLGSFNGVHYADNYGVKNLIKYSDNNLLGYYIKEVGKNSDNTLCSTYYIYLMDANNNLRWYSPRISVGCSTELENLGFKNYFEQQMIKWIKNIEIMSEQS